MCRVLPSFPPCRDSGRVCFSVNHRLPANHRHAAPLAAPARRVAGTVCVKIAVQNTTEKIAEVLDCSASYVTPPSNFSNADLGNSDLRKLRRSRRERRHPAADIPEWCGLFLPIARILLQSGRDARSVRSAGVPPAILSIARSAVTFMECGASRSRLDCRRDACAPSECGRDARATLNRRQDAAAPWALLGRPRNIRCLEALPFCFAPVPDCFVPVPDCFVPVADGTGPKPFFPGPKPAQKAPLRNGTAPVPSGTMAGTSGTMPGTSGTTPVPEKSAPLFLCPASGTTGTGAGTNRFGAFLSVPGPVPSGTGIVPDVPAIVPDVPGPVPDVPDAGHKSTRAGTFVPGAVPSGTGVVPDVPGAVPSGTGILFSGTMKGTGDFAVPGTGTPFRPLSVTCNPACGRDARGISVAQASCLQVSLLREAPLSQITQSAKSRREHRASRILWIAGETPALREARCGRDARATPNRLWIAPACNP